MSSPHENFWPLTDERIQVPVRLLSVGPSVYELLNSCQPAHHLIQFFFFLLKTITRGFTHIYPDIAHYHNKFQISTLTGVVLVFAAQFCRLSYRYWSTKNFKIRVTSSDTNFIKRFMKTFLRRGVCGTHLNTMHHGYSFLKTNSCPKSRRLGRFQYYVREESSGSGTFVESPGVNLESILRFI